MNLSNRFEILRTLWFRYAVFLFSVVSAATAQTAQKKTLTLEGAERVIAAAKAEAHRANAPGAVIAVVDDGGNLMALERLDGTFSVGANVSIRKARTAVMFKKPTRVFEELINSNGKGRTVMTALENFTPLIGGIPIVADGEIVGGVGVSGAASADQDEQLAIAGSNSPNTAGSSSPAVSCFEKHEVDAVFSKGSAFGRDRSSGRQNRKACRRIPLHGGSNLGSEDRRNRRVPAIRRSQ
jgi:uncharacterized protein GlcG (DUF336 family)